MLAERRAHVQHAARPRDRVRTRVRGSRRSRAQGRARRVATLRRRFSIAVGFGETRFACSKHLCSQWLQPSGFTQNVQRTQGIVSGQDVMLQSLGVITSHSPDDNAVDDQAQRAGRNRHSISGWSMRVGAGRSRWPGLPRTVGVITPVAGLQDPRETRRVLAR